MRYEVFDPRNGEAVYRFRLLAVARLVAWWTGLDYAKEGEGWVKGGVR